MNKYLLLFSLLFQYTSGSAQLSWNDKSHLTHQDTLRGTNTPEREWWDVQRYEIGLIPNFRTKTFIGYNHITYKVIENTNKGLMQIDLQHPLVIDSVFSSNGKKISFTNDGNAWYLKLIPQKEATIDFIVVYYSGKPHEAIRPPWDGGVVWKADSLNRPWMTIACQGIGASVWYPCKDLQSDEPDKGVSITITVPDTLVAVSNGRLMYRTRKDSNIISYKWLVVNPINNYDISVAVGKYVTIYDTYKGLKGGLDMSYSVLDYNVTKVKTHLIPQVTLMMNSFERWFGPYPFYEDGYKLIESPFSMEHQSGIAYGNDYQMGQNGVDYSGTSIGMKWDFLIVHESAHEWFGNSITAKDPADKWIQESFASYADELYTKDYFGDTVAANYLIGTRRNIHNDEPIIGPYNVGKEGSSDMNPKGRNMLHIIREIINDDEKFRQLLIGINMQFYHQTVTTAQIENYISKKSGIDFSMIFDQYLRTAQLPTFEYRSSGSKISYKFKNCIVNFSMPIKVHFNDQVKWITPTTVWQNLNNPTKSTMEIDPNFYISIQKDSDD